MYTIDRQYTRKLTLIMVKMEESWIMFFRFTFSKFSIKNIYSAFNWKILS